VVNGRGGGGKENTAMQGYCGGVDENDLRE